MSIFKPKVPDLPPEPTPVDEVQASKKARRRAQQNVVPTILTSGQGISGQAKSILGG